MPGIIPSRVTIDVNLSTLSANFRKIREAVPPLGVIAVLKANAYGLGLPKIASRLGSEGAAAIATAELSEAIVAQQATSGTIPILILGSLLPYEIEPAINAGFRIPIAGLAEAEAVSAAAVRLGKPAICHYAIDTGMSRVGFHPEEADALLPRIASLPNLVSEGIYSHFPTANIPNDAPTATQVGEFKKLLASLAVKGLRFPMIHIANSDGINNVPDSYARPFTHVRTGINLFGSFDPLGNRRLHVKPIFTIRAYLAQVRHVRAGDSIGYGRTFICPRDLLVGTVAAGYADGLPLALSNRGTLLLRGKHCPVIGRICMDYTTISLDQVPDARPGEEIVCLGQQLNESIQMDSWTNLKGTHPYEILCAIGSRVRRNYIV